MRGSLRHAPNSGISAPLFERAKGNFDAVGRQAGLEALEAMLPAASAEEKFDALANANRWAAGTGTGSSSS